MLRQAKIGTRNNIPSYKSAESESVVGQICSFQSHLLYPSLTMRAAWLKGFVIFFCICMTGEICASTDFARMEQLAATQYSGNKRAVETIKAGRALTENARTLSNQAKVEHANNFVNSRVFYASDMEIWGVEDYWATPLELFGKGEGDCEDFAIAKYVTLLLMDVPVQRLRLVYVRARMGNQTLAHMVLAYFETPTSDPLILDNLINAIEPARRRSDLSPVFSFNHEGLWMEGAKTRSADRPAKRLSNWRRVLQRMRSEGIEPSWTSIDSRSVSSWRLAKLRPSLQKIAMSRSAFKKVAKSELPSTMTKTIKSRIALKKVKKRTKSWLSLRKRELATQ